MFDAIASNCHGTMRYRFLRPTTKSAKGSMNFLVTRPSILSFGMATLVTSS